MMNIKQREDETLRSYITHFNKKALSIELTTRYSWLHSWMSTKGKFIFSLYKNNPKTMSDVLYKATKYMNTEDTLMAPKKKPKKRERQEEARQDRGRKATRIGDQREDKHSKSPTGRFASFTPLNASIDQVLMQIKDEGALTFHGKLKGDPSKRPRDKYCCFHRDHDHDTSDYYNLKQQIEAFIRQGKL